MRAEPSPKGLMALIAIVGVALQFSGSLAYSSLALIVWMLGLWAFYPCVLRRMWMPRFWSVTLAVALGSGLLLGQRDEVFFGVSISTQGLCAGALMVVRGAFIFALAGWASKALAHSGLDRIASRFGAQGLVVSTATAIELLPELSHRVRKVRSQRCLANGRGRWKSLYMAAVDLLADCAMMAERIVQKGTGPSVVVLTGPVGSGKTTTVQNLARELSRQGISVGGVVQPKDDSGSSYHLEDVSTGRRWEFASFDLQRAEGKTGYRFNDEAWAIAATRLKWAADHMDVVILDELGLLEAEGQGHWQAFRDGFDKGSAKLWILVVRQDRLDALVPRMGPIGKTIKIPQEKDSIALALSLLELLIQKEYPKTV